MQKAISSQDCSFWSIVNLGECGELYCGQSSPVTEVNKEGRGHPYFTGPEQWDGTKLHVDKWTEKPRRLVAHNSIFITVKGAGVGKMFPGLPGAIGRDIYAFRVNSGLDFKFIYYALRHSIDTVVGHAKGDIPGLSKNHITDHKIALPGVAHQRRIVAKIDELFSEIDKGIESLAVAREQLKVYRQSVLKAAFDGRLTEDWRTINADKIDSPAALSVRILKEREDHYKSVLGDWKGALAKWRAGSDKPAKPKGLLAESSGCGIGLLSGRMAA